MAIRYEERNGRRYAYRCTSKRIPGKKHPVSKKEYLGVVDPETGDLIPKKISSGSYKFTLEDGKFSPKNYGGAMIAAKVAEDIHLREDLAASFGDASDAMLALAMAQAMAPTAFMDTEITMGSSYVRELIGIDGTDFSSQRMSEIARILGEAAGCMEDLFTLRAKRHSDGTFLYDLTSQSTYSDIGGFAEWGKNRDGEPMRQINIGLVTGREGDPVAFDMFPGSISDMTTLRRFAEDMRRRVPGCMLIMDRGFESAGNVAELMEHGMDFVMPCTISSKAVRSMVTDFAKDASKPEFDMMHDGHVYSVCERRLGVIPVDGGYEYVADDDPRSAGCPYSVRAYVCFDPKKRSDDEQELKTALMNKIKELDGRKFDDPAKSFAKRTKWTSKYLEYSLDDRGRIKVGYKNNAMTFFRNRAGMFVMLSPSASWETAMTAYGARNNVEMAFDMFKNELDGKRGRTGDPVRARGRLLIKFLALMIRVRMQIVVSGSKLKDLTVENALMSAATYEIVKEKGVHVRSEKTKRVREIFETFGIDDPDRLPIADPDL